MSDLTSWREVAIPRDDIQDGSFDESSFAADLGLAAEGKGRPEYRDARLFFEQTFLTENLAVVLDELIRRIDGDPAAAGVYRMQTEFGGGKTHTLLSAYHLFSSPETVIQTEAGRELAARMQREVFPAANVVVLDGSAILAGQPTQFGKSSVAHTLLGHLAYGLGGAKALKQVADQDAALLGSSTTQLAALLQEFAPCVIVLDETLEYLVKALPVKTNEGDLATTSLTLIKELVTAVSGVEKVAMLATLTSSRPESYSEEGERLLESLQKVFGRQENVVTPVEGDDIFPILARRLFKTQGDEAVRQQVADAYANYYVSDLADAIPSSYREAQFRERIVTAYPFHPDLVDLLQNRWGSLSGFQRTRGALRLLGHTVKAQWFRKSTSPLIHVGDVDLADDGVRGEVIKVTGESYKSALNADIIRSDAQAPVEDRRRGGQAEDLAVGTGLATAAFLYSFGPDRVLGGSEAQMLAGIGRPGLSKGLVDDVRDSLRDLLWYARVEGGRFRFTTEPNLNKVVLEREGAVTDDRVVSLIYDALRKVAPGTKEVRVVARVVESVDLPDEGRLTLGVLDLDHRIGPNETEDTLRHAEQVLLYRGSAGRANKNAALLLAADAPALTRARNTARTLAAIGDVKADKTRYSRLNQEQKDELDAREKATAERLPDHVAMAFRHLLMLAPGGQSGLQLVHDDLGPAPANTRLDERVVEHLAEADHLILDALAPAALMTERFGVFPDGADSVALEDLQAYFARHPQLPKLASAQVLQKCIARGVRDGVFGISQGATWDAPDSVLRIDAEISADEVQFQPGVFLVRSAPIREEVGRRAQTAPPPIAPAPDPMPTPDGGPGGGTDPLPTPDEPPGEPSAHASKVSLDLRNVPADRVREVLKAAILSMASTGAGVEVDMTIRASSDNGIPRELIDLTVLEGLRQLGIDFDSDIQ